MLTGRLIHAEPPLNRIQASRPKSTGSPIERQRLAAELNAIADARGAGSPQARRAVLDLLKEVMATAGA
jgi:hypothetical protein